MLELKTLQTLICVYKCWGSPVKFQTCLSSGDAAAFDEEWRREAVRYVPPHARALEYGQDPRGGGQQLALPAPSSSTSPHRHESPRHRQHPTRPRYDW